MPDSIVRVGLIAYTVSCDEHEWHWEQRAPRCAECLVFMENERGLAPVISDSINQWRVVCPGCEKTYAVEDGE